MNTKSFSVALVMLALSGFSAAAQTEAAKADAAMTTVQSWDDLRVWYIQTAPARTGGYVNATTANVVSGLLQNHWEDLPLLETMFLQSQGFRDFVTANVGDATECHAAQKISQAAQSACPAGTGELCREISRRLYGAATGPCTP